MKKLFVYAALFFSAFLISFSIPKSEPLWMRYPSISPDGKYIAFAYKGDIYKVNSEGGEAIHLTTSEAVDFFPVWSPDGRSIAFASDRYGNADVFIMPSEGGNAERLTYHSIGDIPYCFTADGKNVIFSSSRMDQKDYTQFPSPGLPELYSVPVTGGRESQLLSIPAEYCNFNKAGDKMLFHDRKGYEDSWRKHHVSSVTRDVWMWEKKENKFTKLTDFGGEDRNAVWSSDEKSIYYLSEKSNSYNVWKMDAANPSSQTQITKFEKNPVRFLTVSKNDLLCYSQNGEIYTQVPGSEPKKVSVNITTDERYKETSTEVFPSGASEFNVAPNGKEVVFVVRGEVFVSSVEGGVTKRITNTPEQERSVSFSPDGKSILYASERNNIWGIYKSSLIRANELHFFNSTILKEEPVLVGNTEVFQPAFSPDGNEVAFIEDRTAVKVINLKTKAIRTILSGDKNYSYADGDQSFEWSPDGKYILVQFLQDGNWRGEIGLMDAEGKGPLKDLTQSGFDAGGTRWFMDGKMMLWFSDRHGMKNVASHGSQSDAYGLFFTKAAFDRFKMSKEDYAIVKEIEEKDKAEQEKIKLHANKGKADTTKKPVENLKIDWDGLNERKVRLTIHSSQLADAVMTPDGEKLFYLTRFEGGFDLWCNKFKEHETKMYLKLDAKGAGQLMIDMEGKFLYFIADGKIVRVKTDAPERKDITFNAEMSLDPYKERAYFFEHEWRQVVKKFYVTDLQNTDWNYYKQNYIRFLPHINNGKDFSEMMSELLGELNASHTGCSYRPQYKNPDETAFLGAYFDESYTGNGLKIAEVMEKGPLVFDGSQIKEGTIIEKINGNEITPTTNYYKFLNRISGKYTLLSCYDEKSGKRWEETVKPMSVGSMFPMMYKRWVKRMQDMTDKLSNGELAYMHVQGMDDESYREFYDQVMGKYVNKKALIVDTRFNGGGWLHDDLATFLSGKKYIDFVPRERKIGVEPGRKWIKPSLVLISEGNYSDAHMFPVVYKTLGIGKLVGMPVPGTGTAVWWETLHDGMTVFGIPEVGVKSADGKYYENTQCEPDVKVVNEYGPMMKGKDQQLEEAVKQLMGK